MQDRSGRQRILVLEDAWLIAEELAILLQDLGYEVVGPVANNVQALMLIASEHVDAALLDVTLGDEKSFPVAKVLIKRDIPFLFRAGHAQTDLPPPFSSRPIVAKPFWESTLCREMAPLIANRPDRR